MKRCILATGILLLAGVSHAWGWTMYYDGFGYDPASTDTGSGTLGYRLPQDGNPAEYPYHVGDTRYYNNTNTPRPLAAQYIYSPSAWVTSVSNAGSGYWPFISPGYSGIDDPAGFTYAGLPAPTGHVVVCFGSANNSGKVSRVSFIDLNQTPPTGPFRAIVRGTLYYSLLLKVIEAPHSLATVLGTPTNGDPQTLLGTGYFHAGFNSEDADGNLPNATTQTPALTRACARLRLRAGSAVDDYKFQIGIESDTGDNATTRWDLNNTYASGVSMTPMLVVVSYEFVNGTTTDDISRMWVNPDQSTLGAASPPTYDTNGTSFPLTSMGGDINQNQIRSFFIREGGNAQGTIQPPSPDAGKPGTEGVQRVVFDEVRTGTSWADVTSTVACTPPSVASINPGAALAGATVTGAAVTGTNFVQGVTLVRLTRTGQSDIVATAVDVSDSSHLTCNFTIPAGAENGNWNLVVITCPTSPATLTDGFRIGCAPGDFNCDSFVDGADVTAFEDCASGPEIPFAPECAGKDLDGDGDVDGDDFSVVQRCYNGAVPADLNCGN